MFALTGLPEFNRNLSRFHLAALFGVCKVINQTVDQVYDHARSNHPGKVAKAGKTRYSNITGKLTKSIRKKYASLNQLAGWHGYIEGVVYTDRVNPRGHPYPLWVEAGTGPHKIRPRNKKVLRWKDMSGRGWVFSKYVDHPGSRAYPFMLTAMLAYRNQHFRRMKMVLGP